MPFSLRDITADDIPSIGVIYREAVVNGTASYEIDPPTDEEMASRLAAITARRYPYIGAVDERGALLGYAYASAFRTRPAYRWLVEDSIYLAPEARGKGIGKALLAELLDRCERLGFRQMIAVIGGAHPASVAVHRSAGFAEAGLLTGTGFKQNRWLDTMLMQKALGEGNATDPNMLEFPGKP